MFIECNRLFDQIKKRAHQKINGEVSLIVNHNMNKSPSYLAEQ